ncbi:uncharacterized protein LOC127879327 [Dreissena polymorpha]|uniref:uncharacterized protein LOC127879327 n=1 Tax=Dreissena polymorpha TaxID=45954 RepID=UPI00226401D8|nr:uncharacterized protein LOC127879327 [Dreissena polymorpha]
MEDNVFDQELFSALEWTDNLNGVPDFDIEKLKHYLIQSREKSFYKGSVRAYKSLKAFKYFEEGFVQRLRHAETFVANTKVYTIHAKVLASYQGKAYQTYVALEKETGIPIGGSCACVAGRGEACSHIAAILFAVEDFIAKGLNQSTDKPTCTDRLCAWNAPSKQNVEPETIHNIRIVKQAHGKQLKDHVTFDGIGFDPRQAGDRQVDLVRKNELVQALKRSNSKCNFLKYQTVSDNASGIP